MYRKFPSIGHAEERAYCYNTDDWSDAPIACAWRFYQTYGDGLTAHSPDYPIPVEMFADYCLSLAASVLESPELGEQIYFKTCMAPDVQKIAFCAGVRFKPAAECSVYAAKPQYWSAEEMKVSSSPAKRHDRRYEEVRPWNDGSPGAIVAMLTPDYADGLHRWQIACAVREWCFADDKNRPYMELVGRFLKWTEDSDAARDMAHGWETLKYAAESWQRRHAAESAIENERRRIAYRAQRAAEESESPTQRTEEAAD